MTNNKKTNKNKTISTKLSLFYNLKNNISKKHMIIILGILSLSLFVLIFAGSYAFFTSTVSSKDYIVYTGNLKVDFEHNGNTINLSNTIPMTNQEGRGTEGYTFNVKNTGTIPAKYQVRLELASDNEIPIEYIKYAYQKTQDESTNVSSPVLTESKLLSDLNSSMVLFKDEQIGVNKTDTINLKLWIDIDAPNDIQGKTFKAKIVIDSMQDVEDGYVFNSSPIIKLKRDTDGNINANLKVNDSYADPGVESIIDDKDDLSISNVTSVIEYYDGTNLTTVNSIDTSVTGVYFITYSVMDSQNVEGKAIRTITVNNTAAIPTITLNGASSITINKNQSFVDPGVTVSTGNVATIGEVKTTKVGTYIIRYIVIDNNGNMNSITRSVVVEGVNLSGFALKIYENSTIITTEPTLADENGEALASSTCEASGLTYDCTEIDSGGLYSINVANGFGGANGTSYYFRGNVENNYVKFGKWSESLYYGYYSTTSPLYNRYTSLAACQGASVYNSNCTKIHDSGDDIIWRIIRINEDGTIRLMLNEEANTIYTDYNTSTSTINDMYYSSSSFKQLTDNWYNSTIGSNQAYSSKVAIGNYFCESLKVINDDSYGTGSASPLSEEDYLPDLTCPTDGNGKGLVNGSVGLITYDELRLAGSSQYDNVDYYLYKELYYATMSPAGMDQENYSDDETGDPIDMPSIWSIYAVGGAYSVYPVTESQVIVPVINIIPNVSTTGTGTEADPYVVY